MRYIKKRNKDYNSINPIWIPKQTRNGFRKRTFIFLSILLSGCKNSMEHLYTLALERIGHPVFQAGFS